MTISEQIIKLLRDGELVVTQDGNSSGMILTNFVDFGRKYILMHGTWFSDEWPNYGNEIHIRDADLVHFSEWEVSTIWTLKHLKLTHWKRDTGWDDTYNADVAKIKKAKNRTKYDFDAAQKIVANKEML